jgi:hypothetical protein
MLFNQTVPETSASLSAAGGASHDVDLDDLFALDCTGNQLFPVSVLPDGSFRQGLQPLQSRMAWRAFLQPLDYLTGNRTL